MKERERERDLTAKRKAGLSGRKMKQKAEEREGTVQSMM